MLIKSIRKIDNVKNYYCVEIDGLPVTVATSDGQSLKEALEKLLKIKLTCVNGQLKA